jgi:hypothetical protein
MGATLPQPVSTDSPRRFPGVVLDGMLFTLVEPDRDVVVEYNRWYEGDHFYATVVGPGVLSGRRFVCTRSLKDLRISGPDPIVSHPSIGSFLALYLLTDTDAFNEWGAVNTKRLHDAGRIFTAREHVHTLMYRHQWSWTPDGTGVSPELSLDHPFGLVVAEFWHATEPDDDSLAIRLAERYAPLLHRGTSAQLILAFTPRQLLDDAPGDVPRASDMDGTVLMLHFHGDVPADAVMAGVGAARTELEGLERARLRFASPFIPTIPATDCYTDQLW